MTLAMHPIAGPADEDQSPRADGAGTISDLVVTLLTGGIDPHYATGLTTALASRGVGLDVIGNTEMDTPEMSALSTVQFLNLHGDSRQKTGVVKRNLRHLGFYAKLIRYAFFSRSAIFHVLWNYRLQLFDRTLLMLYYKVLGKKVLLTAHNVNAAERDGKESAMNRWSLKVQYGLVNHIFVHTDKMKEDLVCGYDVAGDKVSIIPFGIYDCVPNTRLTPSEAKRKLGLNESQKTILFFGRILPYKGLSYLVDAFRDLIKEDDSYRLVIAGEPKKETAEYWREIRESIEREKLDDNVLQRIGFIADEEIEVYFKAADALILPYTMIFQSGVLFMAFSFGLPVIATDVGSLRDDIDEGETGYVCRPCDSADLGRAIATYFASDLFKNLAQKRLEIMALARKRNSWDAVSDKTCHVYTKLLAHKERSDESLRLHD